MNKELKSAIVRKYGNQFLFALALGEHEAAISRIVRGRRTLDPESQKRWAKVLGISDPKQIFSQAGRKNE